MMIKKTIILVTLLSSILPTYVAAAAEVEVTWTHPEKYRDVRAGESNGKHFKKRTFKKLEQHLTKLSSALPDKQVLKINVTDLDLAGNTLHGGVNQIRIVKEIYFPSMKFSYQLLDQDKKIILAGEEARLKDMNFMSQSHLRYNNDSLGYEKRMLDTWFKKTFSPMLH